MIKEFLDNKLFYTGIAIICVGWYYAYVGLFLVDPLDIISKIKYRNLNELFFSMGAAVMLFGNYLSLKNYQKLYQELANEFILELNKEYNRQKSVAEFLKKLEAAVRRSRDKTDEK